MVKKEPGLHNAKKSLKAITEMGRDARIKVLKKAGLWPPSVKKTVKRAKKAPSSGNSPVRSARA